MSDGSADRQRLRALPKAEIHVHLEGCFSRPQIVALAAAAGEPLSRPPEALFDFKNLAEFLGFLDWSCGLVRTIPQVELMAYAFAERLAENGAGYADAIINPTHWPSWRYRLPEMIEALDRGFRAAEQDGLPPVGLCLSLLRQQSADEAVELLDMMIALRSPRVVALSIDGNEASAGRTGPRFADTFRRAAAAGFRRTAHAGESSGPEGIRDAIRLLGAERIDHGVRAVEDASLMDELRDLGLPLDITPASNVRLGLYPSYEEHPVERLRRHGIPVSISTDDPELLETTLIGEYARMVETFGWDDEVLRSVARTSIEVSFAPPEIKRDLLAKLAAW
ncbi:MAG: adenosine deaminase [Proteobacteria bacterium]|nr:adenosine deaminase [Pseudomonadota bacterium]